MTDVVQPKLLPLPSQIYSEPLTGRPTKEFALYMQSLDAAIRSTLVLANTLAGVAVLTTAGNQTLLGGFAETEVDLGSPANGATITPSPLTSLKQKVTNNVAGFTIAAHALVGDVELRVVNGAAAGAITFSGFTKKWTGDALDTTNAHEFTIFIFGFGTKAFYVIKASQ